MYESLNWPSESGSGAKTKVGFQGGVLVGVPLGDAFCLQPEVNYSMQGAKASSSGQDFTLSQNYLNVPVLFKYKHESGLTNNEASGSGSTGAVKNSVIQIGFFYMFGGGK